MANVDAAFGFRPVRYISGAPYNGAVNPYLLTNATNNAVFVGDPVTIVGTANTAVVEVVGAGSFVPGSLPTVLRTAAGDGNPISGVIVAFAADPTALENTHRLDSTERVAYVCDDPDVVFEIQGDSAATIDVANIGLNAAFIGATGLGSTVTGLSGVELDSGTEAADGSLQVIILRAINRVGNDITAVHAQWEVMISSHTRRNSQGGSDDGVLGR